MFYRSLGVFLQFDGSILVHKNHSVRDKQMLPPGLLHFIQNIPDQNMKKIVKAPLLRDYSYRDKKSLFFLK